MAAACDGVGRSRSAEKNAFPPEKRFPIGAIKHRWEIYPVYCRSNPDPTPHFFSTLYVNSSMLGKRYWSWILFECNFYVHITKSSFALLCNAPFNPAFSIMRTGSPSSALSYNNHTVPLFCVYCSRFSTTVILLFILHL